MGEEKSSLKIVLTDHATFQAKRRRIPLDLIEKIAREPQQKLLAKKKRFILQGRYRNEVQKREMVLRVVVDEEKNVRRVITAYKSSKVDKYWKKEVEE